MDFDILLACDFKGGMADTTSSRSVHQIPWDVPEDMNHFRLLTTTGTGPSLVASETGPTLELTRRTNAIIMGRKTADTFFEPLPNRMNIVITSNENYRLSQSWKRFPTLDLALDFLASQPEIARVFVIGGALLADCAIKHKRCRNIYLNIILHDYHCDVLLPDKFLDLLDPDNKYYTFSRKISQVRCETLKKKVEWMQCIFTYQNIEELRYLDLLEKILAQGHYRQTRNAKTYSLFGEKLEFDLDNGFPLLTTKKMFFRGIVEELLFFLRGDTDTKKLEERKVMIWHENTTKEFIEQNNKVLLEGDMGPMYGYQWRHFNAPYYAGGKRKRDDGQGLDQLATVIDLLVKDPHSRRILMTSYNPAQADMGVLYPCHGLTIQFYVEKNNRISLQMYQRSCDAVCGKPFNIASYALLLTIVTNLVNNHLQRKHQEDYRPGRLIMVFGDVHVYSDEKADHVTTVREQLKRRDQTYPFCQVRIYKALTSLDDLNTLESADIVLEDYVCGTALKAKMIA